MSEAGPQGSTPVGRHDSIGLLGGIYAVLAPLGVLLPLVLATQQDSLLARASVDGQLAQLLETLVAVSVGLLIGLGAPLWAVSMRRRIRSRGRLRMLMCSAGGMVNALGVVGLAFVFGGAAEGIPSLSGMRLRPSPELATWATIAGTACILGAVTTIGGSAATWQLVPRRLRMRIWIMFDGLLLVAVAYVVLRLPTQPAEGDTAALGAAVLRHVVTTIGVLRLTSHVLPWLMNLVERFGFQPLVASRHLRSQKSGFLAAISLLSVLAVTVSSCALTTTLSVMGGFRSDLKRKILGNHAHIVVDRDHATIEGWDPLLQATRKVPGVTGATPFVSGEVMLSSASNLATAVLQGVEPATVGQANDLPRNLKSGKLEYLSHPEKLLDLPSGMRGWLPLTKSPAEATDEPAGPGEAGAAADAEKDIKQRIEDMDAFLRQMARGGAKPEDRDLLPGIIIGQELARSLRLYLGDEVNVVAPLGALGPSGPMPKARPFRVAGIFYSGMYEYDMKFTYTELGTAQKFLGTGDAISGFEVKVQDVNRAPDTALAIRSSLGDRPLRVRDWQELNSRLFGALALEKLAMFIALGIAILVASFCIAGTLTLMVQEKGREVAILKAMGTSDSAIVRVFLIEGGLIGLLGASLGLFLGYMMCFAAEHFGIRMNPEVYYIDRLPVYMDTSEFVFTGVAAVIICLLVTIYPALLASRLRPVEALRYE